MAEKNIRNPWLDLAEELGLPPELRSTPAERGPEPAAEVSKPQQDIPPEVKESVAEVVVVPPEAPVEEPPPPRTRRKRAVAVVSEPEAETPAEAAEVTESGESGRDPAPTRSRRRKRTTKTSEPAETPPEASPVTADPIAEETPAPMLTPSPLLVSEESTPVVPDEAHQEISPLIAEPPQPISVVKPAITVQKVILSDPPQQYDPNDFAAGLDDPVPPPVEEEVDAEGSQSGELEGPTRDGRRRRRRRRGRKSEGEGQILRRVASTSEDDETEEDSSGDELVSEDIVDEVVNETPTALDEEAEEFEDLSDLNVPSWAELVGSLYRPPER